MRAGPASVQERWKQADYLRDLVVYALRSRLAVPEETAGAERVLASGGPLDEATDRIAYDEVRALNEDKAFRLALTRNGLGRECCYGDRCGSGRIR